MRARRRPPIRSGRDARPPRALRPLLVAGALAVAAGLAGGGPVGAVGPLGAADAGAATAVKQTKRKGCPTVGRTLAVERYGRRPSSRVWRTHGRTYGCIVGSNGRGSNVLLTRALPHGLVLRDDTVAWTTPHVSAGVRTDRVFAAELRYGSRFLASARAVPAATAGAPRRDAPVAGLRVAAGQFAAWIADGTTVVVAGREPEQLELPTPDGTGTPVHTDGNAAVVASYPAAPGLAEALSGSLVIDDVPGDPGDADDCAYAYAKAFRWSPAAGQTFEADLRGTRTTPEHCGG